MRTDDRSLPSGFPIVAWSYWQLNMAAGSAIRFHIASLGGWMEISFLGKLGGYDDHPLLLNWLLCYRPMTLLLDLRAFGFAYRGVHCEYSMVCVSRWAAQRASGGAGA